MVLCLSAVFIAGCSSNKQPVANDSCNSQYPFTEIRPENAGPHLRAFSKVTNWIEKNNAPVVSVLLSVNGKLIYEFYASKPERNTSRNVMSVTKGVTSALLGIALDRGHISSPDSSVVDYFPTPIQKNVFDKFKPITIKNVMAMSVLDARTWPKTKVQAKVMAHEFHISENRFNFAIKQKILGRPGTDFQYTDVAPALISAILQNATHKNLFDFANQSLFQPMGFKGQGWLFRDGAGYDIASYGLELRPVDMHKFGILYLNHGCWGGKQLVSHAWVQQSFTPQIKSTPDSTQLDYGWYWWKHELKPGWKAHLARGWHGQRLAIFPEKGVVISITANAPDESEERIVEKIFDLLLTALASDPHI